MNHHNGCIKNISQYLHLFTIKNSQQEVWQKTKFFKAIILQLKNKLILKKSLNKLSVEESYFNMIKAHSKHLWKAYIYKKPTADIMLNSEKPKDFLLRSRTRQGCPLLPLLFNTVMEVLAKETSPTKRNKSHSNQKERSRITPV